MVRFNAGTIATLSVLSSEIFVSAQDDCEPIANLGTSNLDRYNYSSSIETDDSGTFTMSIKFQFDDTLPVPTDPVIECDPTIVPPAIASDNLPYFAFRWAYDRFNQEIKDITGLDHVSIDFNSCGHPPQDVFTIPHIDMHLYFELPEFRTCMTCTKIPETPICDFNEDAQTTDSGLAFFNVSFVPGTEQPINMPAGYTVGYDHMVPLMGGHSWDVTKQPSLIEGKPWINPIWVIGSYAGSIIDYEPMIPMSFITGDENHFYEEELEYVGQTIDELPTKYSVAYNSETKFVTLTMEGKSASPACTGLREGKCGKKDYCAYNGNKKLKHCIPKEGREFDCAGRPNENKCVKKSKCEWKGDVCAHICDIGTADKEECKAVTYGDKNRKICSWSKKDNPCFKCHPIECSSS